VQFFFADHVLDLERRELKRGSQQIALEPQVFDLLAYLIQTVIGSSARTTSSPQSGTARGV